MMVRRCRQCLEKVMVIHGPDVLGRSQWEHWDNERWGYDWMSAGKHNYSLLDIETYEGDDDPDLVPVAGLLRVR